MLTCCSSAPTHFFSKFRRSKEIGNCSSLGHLLVWERVTVKSRGLTTTVVRCISEVNDGGFSARVAEIERHSSILAK